MKIYDVQSFQLKREAFIKKTIVDKVLNGNSSAYDSFIESSNEQLEIHETVFTCPGYYPSCEVLLKKNGKVLGIETFTYIP
ncbi:hypothetical protein QQ054_32040 [Oscillatoria amoena NRMC-F 0135]|nr:hypothetical protein [Oscillatoria amoena NRMC-F 0135]